MKKFNGGILGKITDKSSTGVSGIFDTYQQNILQKSSSWSQFQVESVSNSNGTALDENVNSTITVTTSGVPDNTTLYYSVATVSGTTLTSADFITGDVTGSFTITNNSGSFILRPIGDDLSESNVVKVQIRRGSVSGDILAETGNLTIADDTAPSGAPFFNWKYYAYGSNINTTYILWVQSNGTQNTLRAIAGQQQSNSSSSWISYAEDLAGYSGTTGRIYIAYKVGTSYRQDPQFDDMELIDTTSGDISHDPTTATGRGRWEKNTSYTTTLVPPTTSFSSVTVSTNTGNVWNWDSGGTPSSSTGSPVDAAGSSSGYYLYFEGSSPNYASSLRYYWVRMTQDYTLL